MFGGDLQVEGAAEEAALVPVHLGDEDEYAGEIGTQNLHDPIMPGSIERSCRACGRPDPVLVLDLGSQPAADHFPSVGHPGPDPTHPLALRLCAACGLAQLDRDDTDAEEPRAVEPAALRLQAAAAVAELAAAGCLTEGATAAEFGSPHGGSWQQLLAGHGVQAVGTEPADLVLDCFGMMHEADQAAAVQARADRLAPAGTLLLQFHSIAAILRQGQWNALRHGHFAYYSLTTLIPLLATAGLRVRRAWEFDLYGGTVLIAADRTPAADRRTSPADDNPSAGGLPTTTPLPTAPPTTPCPASWPTKRPWGSPIPSDCAPCRSRPTWTPAGCTGS